MSDSTTILRSQSAFSFHAALRAVILVLGLTRSMAVLAANPASDPASRFAGYASCLARGCHGGDEVTSTGALAPAGLLNAATVWINHDRHRRAYATLRTDRSRSILARLRHNDPAAWTRHDPTTEVRCLSCHTTPSLATSEQAGAALTALRSEGVSCDACHTRDGADSLPWVDRHPRGDLAVCRSDPSLGLRPLSTATQRAEVCVGCHVGGPAQVDADVPLRDMNHDMIAAGHPRLFFDYATYIQLMPPHWQEPAAAAQRPSPQDPRGDVRGVLDGQLAALRAETRLIADRSSPGRPWPEFASLECYGCHHGLQDPSPRRESRRTSLGRVEWIGLTSVSRGAPLGRGSTELVTSLNEVNRALQRFAVPAANDLSLLSSLKSYEPAMNRPVDELERLLMVAPVADAAGAAQPIATVIDSTSWTYYARRYYLMRELHRLSVTHLRGQAASDTEIPSALGELRRQLVLESGSRGVNSPASWNPDEVARLDRQAADEVLAQWRQDLTAWEKTAKDGTRTR